MAVRLDDSCMVWFGERGSHCLRNRTATSSNLGQMDLLYLHSCNVKWDGWRDFARSHRLLLLLL